LQVTETAHPIVKDTALPNGANYGFKVNSMRIVANKSVGKKHPDAAKLFSIMTLSVNDISAQNQLITEGQTSPADINRHVDSWIKAHQETFDGWIAQAKAAK
jgi:glycine betaine/proline transport system substrate-binding protein